MSREVEKTLDSIGISHLWKRMVDYVNGVMPKKTTDLVNDAGFITDFSELPPDQRERLRGPRGLQGNQGDQGNPGEPGRGIESIRKTSSSGLTDTYTVTFNDGSSYQYNVVNGKDGADASTQGISYNDLNDKPTIPANLSELQDDTGHRTVSDTEKATWSNKSDFSGNYNDLSEAPDFKTINGESIIGTGDIVIQGGGGTQIQSDWDQSDSTKVDYIKNKPDVYEKPSTGIPSTDLSSAVQTSLSKADTALQSETDPTVPSWAKASSKPCYTASEVGAVPTTRKVNGKALSSDVTLSASDVGALPDDTPIPVVPTNVSCYSDDTGEGIVPDAATNIDDYEDGDFCISDSEGNVLVKFSGGNIHVKHFTSSPLKEKRISFIGDSITTYADYPGSNNPFYTGSNAGVTSVDQTWWKSLCDNQEAILNRIYAYGGGDLINRLCLQYNNLYSGGTTGTPPDVVFILAGINDWYHNNTLGTIADAENSNTTFYAAYKYLLKNLKETYPNAQIIGLTMLNSMIKGITVPYLNNNNVSIRDFCKAVVECCDYYSVPSIDLNKIVNINGGNYTELLADYTHPNITGIGMMTKAIMNNIHNVIYY